MTQNEFLTKVYTQLEQLDSKIIKLREFIETNFDSVIFDNEEDEFYIYDTLSQVQDFLEEVEFNTTKALMTIECSD